MKEARVIWVLRIISNGTGILRDQWIWLLSIWDMYESTSIESGKLPFRKKVGQQFPFGMSLSVFIPTLNSSPIDELGNWCLEG